MFVEYEKNFNQLRMNSVFRQVIASRQVGVSIWNLTEKTLNIYENFSEYNTEDIQNFSDYIRLVAYEKDVDMALQNLKTYLENSRLDYKSNFRIVTKSGELKWVLLKGRIVNVGPDRDELLQLLMYDVTGRNFESGNDKITNLLNRDYFLNKLSNVLMYQAPDKKHAVIGTRLHHIPEFNSYTLRSSILRQLSQKLLSLLDRKDEVAKFPGERFFLYVHDYKNETELKALTRNIYTLLKEPILINQRQIVLDASVGVAAYPKDSTDAIELIGFAELAKRQSATNPSQRINFFREEFVDKETKNTVIEVELAQALHKEEFYLVYQLQVNSATSNIIGIEALIRWENSKLGDVPPDEFIPLAENNGYILSIGQWVLEEAVRTAKSWHEKGYEFGSLSINVSPNEIMQDHFIDNLLTVCAKYDVPHSLIGIEITEGSYLHNVKNSLEKIQALIQNDFVVSVDDFGTGYSNFVFLIQAKMNTVKIDKSIIQDLDDTETELLIRGIINLTKDLNYNIIAEGVETQEQVDMLSTLGLHHIQGYFYSKPVIQSEIEKSLKRKQVEE